MSDFKNVESTDYIKSHDCNQCGKRYGSRWQLNRHIKTHSGEKEYNCEICGKGFYRLFCLIRHKKSHVEPSSEIVCDLCERRFKRKHDLERHMKSHDKEKEVIKCELCAKIFTKKENLRHHLKVRACIRKREYEEEKLRKGKEQMDGELKRDMENEREEQKVIPSSANHSKKRTSALGIFSTEEILPSAECSTDLILFLDEVTPAVTQFLKEELLDKRSIKWYMTVEVVMTRIVMGDEDALVIPHFRCHVLTDLTEDFLNVHIEEAKSKILSSFDEFADRGSGWMLEKIKKLEICSARYRPMHYTKL